MRYQLTVISEVIQVDSHQTRFFGKKVKTDSTLVLFMQYCKIVLLPPTR